MLSSAGLVNFTDETICTTGYCPSASSAQIVCPDGYHLDVLQKAHNEFNCHANPAAGYYDTGAVATESCTAGAYCPEAVQDATKIIPCPPGHYSDATDNEDKSDCTACPEGKYCPELSVTADIVNCEAGFYCPNRTRYPFENACPGGTFSTASLNAETKDQCTACSLGSYCKQGSGAETTCPNNAYCPAGSTLYTDCAINFHRSSTGGTASSSCTACAANFMCPGGTDPIACPAGFSGISASNTDPKFMLCSPTTNGSLTSTSGVS